MISLVVSLKTSDAHEIRQLFVALTRQKVLDAAFAACMQKMQECEQSVPLKTDFHL